MVILYGLAIQGDKNTNYKMRASKNKKAIMFLTEIKGFYLAFAYNT